jgi:protein SCO1/2
MCPLLITHLQRIEQALPPEVRAVTRILLVSLDPARDTPDKLKLLAAEHGIDTARWSLTRTPEASVRQLAAVLNVRYRRVPTGEIAHSSIITALDAQGVPTLRVEDASGDPGELVRALSHAATGLAHSGD